MDQARPNTTKHKAKSDWQLFTNDGRFDNKLPPSQRLLRIKSGLNKHKLSVEEREETRIFFFSHSLYISVFKLHFKLFSSINY